MQRQKVLVIVGPTASGKSALAVQLAKKFTGEVISADSRQVYKGLDMGTGKITRREMQGIPHHLLDVASPKKKFSAGDFVRHAQKAHSHILKNMRMSIVVGGTGFYIDALLGRIDLPDVAPDAKLRARLGAKTAEQLYALLKKRDPKRARMMNTPSERNNKVRLIRALEIASDQGRSLVRLPRTVLGNADMLWIGISPPFAELEKKIAMRLKARIRAGMIAEAKRLHASGLSFKRMEELGLEYRSLARLLQGIITRAEFEAELYRDIRRYAKKQLAYWKRNKAITWFDPKDTQRIQALVKKWLSTSPGASTAKRR